MMNKQKWFYLSGLVLLILALFLVLFPDLFHDRKEKNRSFFTNSQREKNESEKDRASETSRNHRQRTFGFSAVALTKPPNEPKGVIFPKFKTGGSGTRGAIRDQEGNLILRASLEKPAISITISPNEELIWVSGGDIKSYIINSRGEEVADLPLVPPGKDMLGFGKWVWIDNNTLLGESGLQNFDEQGKPIGCCQGHNVSESRYFVYDLETEQMKELKLPETLNKKVVTIGKVLKTGEVQLGHEGDGFSWYRIESLSP